MSYKNLVKNLLQQKTPYLTLSDTNCNTNIKGQKWCGKFFFTKNSLWVWMGWVLQPFGYKVLILSSAHFVKNLHLNNFCFNFPFFNSCIVQSSTELWYFLCKTQLNLPNTLLTHFMLKSVLFLKTVIKVFYSFCT